MLLLRNLLKKDFLATGNFESEPHRFFELVKDEVYSNNKERCAEVDNILARAEVEAFLISMRGSVSCKRVFKIPYNQNDEGLRDCAI